MATLHEIVAKEAQIVADEWDEKLTKQQLQNIYAPIAQYIRDRTLAEIYIMTRIRQARKNKSVAAPPPGQA